MTSDQRPERDEQTTDVGLLLRADDGTMYLIPRDALETFRLTDDARAALERHMAEAGDVQGHQYIGQFSMTRPVWTQLWGWGYWSNEKYFIDPKSTGYPGLR
jgi:hypothetical protein